MKLATLNNGSRDGRLLLVSRDLSRALDAGHIAATLQLAIENWWSVEPELQALYRELNAAGVDTALDDRGLRPGAMFADMELIGIPHRIVVSERGLAAGSFEYRHRRAAQAETLDRAALLARLAPAAA